MDYLDAVCDGILVTEGTVIIVIENCDNDSQKIHIVRNILSASYNDSVFHFPVKYDSIDSIIKFLQQENKFVKHQRIDNCDFIVLCDYLYELANLPDIFADIFHCNDNAIVDFSTINNLCHEDLITIAYMTCAIQEICDDKKFVINMPDNLLFRHKNDFIDFFEIIAEHLETNFGQIQFMYESTLVISENDIKKMFSFDWIFDKKCKISINLHNLGNTNIVSLNIVANNAKRRAKYTIRNGIVRYT